MGLCLHSNSAYNPLTSTNSTYNLFTSSFCTHPFFSKNIYCPHPFIWGLGAFLPSGMPRQHIQCFLHICIHCYIKAPFPQQMHSDTIETDLKMDAWKLTPTTDNTESDDGTIHLRLQHELASFWVLGDVGSETDSAGPLAGSVLSPGDQAVNILQQLRLAGARISTQQQVQLRPATTQNLWCYHLKTVLPFQLNLMCTIFSRSPLFNIIKIHTCKQDVQYWFLWLLHIRKMYITDFYEYFVNNTGCVPMVIIYEINFQR